MIVTVIVSVTVALWPSVAVTTFSKVIVWPAVKKSRSKLLALKAQLAVLFELSVTVIALSKAVFTALGILTPELPVTVEVAAVIDVVSSKSAKVMVPLLDKLWAEASEASLTATSTAPVVRVGASLVPVIVTVTVWSTVPPFPSDTVTVNVSVTVSPASKYSTSASATV